MRAIRRFTVRPVLPPSLAALGDLAGGLATEAADRLGPLASGHDLDVADKESFEAFLAAAEEQHGRPLDILVNNAGIMPNAAFLDQPDHIDRLTMDINVFGVIHGLRLAAPGMIERGRGHIVNVASLAGKFPLKGLAVYNASKYAVVGLTAATRLELDKTGVSVSAILPSAVKTELSSGIDFGLLPAVEPEDIAAAVLKSVRSRAAEIAVPNYVGAATKIVPLMPEGLVRAFRAAAHDDAAISKVDEGVRRRYLDRITGAP